MASNPTTHCIVEQKFRGHSLTAQLKSYTVNPCREEFTLHGLWINFDTGKYPQFCDRRTHFDATKVAASSIPTRDYPSDLRVGSASTMFKTLE